MAANLLRDPAATARNTAGRRAMMRYKDELRIRGLLVSAGPKDMYGKLSFQVIITDIIPTSDAIPVVDVVEEDVKKTPLYAWRGADRDEIDLYVYTKADPNLAKNAEKVKHLFDVPMRFRPGASLRGKIGRKDVSIPPLFTVVDLANVTLPVEK